MLIEEVASYRADAIEALGDLAALDPYYVTTRYPDAIGGGVPGASFFPPRRDACDRTRFACRRVGHHANPAATRAVNLASRADRVSTSAVDS